MNELSHINRSKLCKHLRDHEDDIARNAVGFDGLNPVFWAMFQRNAKRTIPIAHTVKIRELKNQLWMP